MLVNIFKNKTKRNIKIFKCLSIDQKHQNILKIVCKNKLTTSSIRLFVFIL